MSNGKDSGWISVDLSPPTITTRALVKNYMMPEAEEVVEAYICPEYKNIIWQYESGEECALAITHWQPL